jgi:hypothetical protein
MFQFDVVACINGQPQLSTAFRPVRMRQSAVPARVTWAVEQAANVEVVAVLQPEAFAVFS